MAVVLFIAVAVMLLVEFSLGWPGTGRQWWDPGWTTGPPVLTPQAPDASPPVETPDLHGREEALLVRHLMAGDLKATDYHQAMAALAHNDELLNPLPLPPS